MELTTQSVRRPHSIQTRRQHRRKHGGFQPGYVGGRHAGGNAPRNHRVPGGFDPTWCDPRSPLVRGERCRVQDEGLDRKNWWTQAFWRSRTSTSRTIWCPFCVGRFILSLRYSTRASSQEEQASSQVEKEDGICGNWRNMVMTPLWIPTSSWYWVARKK